MALQTLPNVPSPTSLINLYLCLGKEKKIEYIKK